MNTQIVIKMQTILTERNYTIIAYIQEIPGHLYIFFKL